MVAELVIAVFVVEYARSCHYINKESKRDARSAARFGEILKQSKTWEELGSNLHADTVNNPELYARIRQTWMIRLYWRLKGE